MKTRRLPKYRHHKARNLAKVWINGREIYLGVYNSPESLREYARIVGVLRTDGEVCVPNTGELTVGQLVTLYETSVENEYSEGMMSVISAVAKSLRKEFGAVRLSSFDSSCLIRLQDLLLERGLSRKYINETIATVKRVFKWGVPRKYVTSNQHAELSTVESLKRRSFRGQEKEPIRPVSDELIEQTLPYLPKTVAVMVQIQRLIGCRPAQIRLMRPREIDRSQSLVARSKGCWAYTPGHHKNSHRGKRLRIPIGPRVQEILLPFLLRPAEHYCFSSDGSGQRAYTKDTYARAISRACKRAGLPHWHPNQLRHTAATEIRANYGLEHAQAALGHAHASTTEIYAEVDWNKAIKVACEIG